MIDNLVYTHHGNQVTQITDNATSAGFPAGSFTYGFDANGNLIRDEQATITYNLLNLPQQIQLSGGRSIENTYAADGRKLFASATENNQPVSDGTRYYNGNLVFDINGELEYILMPEGRILNNNGTYEYEYHLKDHLGSVRVAFTAANNTKTVVQENAYYPFGATIGDLSYAAPLNNNRYGYTGQEQLNDFDLNWYDYIARNYNPLIGRFNSIDPLAEKYYSISPYAYCANNPVRYVDPYGMDVYRYDDKTGEMILHQTTNDDFDQIGKFKYDRKSDTYTLKTNRQGEARTRMDNVEKGILSDGVNFMQNNNVIAVGGEGQATVGGVETFAVNLSDMVGKEIGGAYFSKDGAESTTHMTIGRYVNNKFDQTKGHGNTAIRSLVTTLDEFNSYKTTGFFHTHPSSGNISVSDRTRPSGKDLESRDNDLKLSPSMQFYILTHPITPGGAFPYKINYTKWR